MSNEQIPDVVKNFGKGAFQIFVLTSIFYGGMELGSIKQNVRNHKELDMHEGSRDTFVPRTELQLTFDRIESDIKEIKQDIKEIKAQQ